MVLSTRNNAYTESLTSDNAAMVLIDHQTGLMLAVQTSDMQTLRNKVIGLAKIAKQYNLPTILTFGGVASPAKGVNGPLMPELKEILPTAAVIDRVKINAWDDSKFVHTVENLGRKKLIMAGVSTDVCLAFPALAAVAAGYDVYAVIDASGTWDKTVEQAAMLRMMQAGVIVTNWVSVAAELQKDWTADPQGYATIFGEHFAAFAMLTDTLEANGVKVS